jgi:hypothetical protein
MVATFQRIPGLQQHGFVFFLKTDFSVVFLLIFDVGNHLFYLSNSHGKSTVAILPVKRGIEYFLAIYP